MTCLRLSDGGGGGGGEEAAGQIGEGLVCETCKGISPSYLYKYNCRGPPEYIFIILYKRVNSYTLNCLKK